VTGPIPPTLRTGSFWIKLIISSLFGSTLYIPLGLFIFAAILDNRLFGAIPIEQVSFVFVKIFSFISCATVKAV